MQIHLTVAGCSIQLTSLSPHPVLVIGIGIGCIGCIGCIGGIDIGIGNDDAAGIGIGGIVRIGGIGIGIGVAYNFYLKPTALSPIPYALAFALLPAALVISTDRTPPLWLLWAGGLLGLSAHFANVLKDFSEDKASGIQSLPITLGRIPSRLIAATFLIAATIVLNSASANTPILVIGIIAATLSVFAPKFILFKLLMLVALLDVILLVSAAGELIGSRTV